MDQLIILFGWFESIRTCQTVVVTSFQFFLFGVLTSRDPSFTQFVIFSSLDKGDVENLDLSVNAKEFE